MYATNPKAFFDYQILEKKEAGIVLTGNEVKSVKKNQISIKGAYVKIIDGEIWLVGANISPYQPANAAKDYDPQKTRKLLIKKKEIKFLESKLETAGITLVPLKVYGKKNKIKVEIGIARGKKKYDKRETIKKRETERIIKRVLKKTR